MTNNTQSSRSFLLLGALFALLSVAAGAFGAHALRSRLSFEDLATFEIAVRYQMYHALALLAVAWLSDSRPSRFATVAGSFFTAGILIFSGSLYFLVLTGPRWLGAITPIGGLCFLVGWLLVAIAAFHGRLDRHT